MSKLNNLRLLCLLGSLFGCSLFSNVLAQGLKGSDYGPHEVVGRRTYVNGNNDAERWKTLQDIQSHLLGLDRKQVKTALGEPDNDKGVFRYAITQDPISATPKKWAQLSIVFKDGKVSKFSIEAAPR